MRHLFLCRHTKCVCTAKYCHLKALVLRRAAVQALPDLVRLIACGVCMHQVLARRRQPWAQRGGDAGDCDILHTHKQPSDQHRHAATKPMTIGYLSTTCLLHSDPNNTGAYSATRATAQVPRRQAARQHARLRCIQAFPAVHKQVVALQIRRQAVRIDACRASTAHHQPFRCTAACSTPPCEACSGVHHALHVRSHPEAPGIQHTNHAHARRTGVI